MSSSFGGPVGAAGSIIIGGSFWGGEQYYDATMRWIHQTGTLIHNMEQGLLNGWIPKF